MGAARTIRIFEGDIRPIRIDELKIEEDVLQSRAGTDQDIVRIFAERRRGKPKQPGTPFPPVLVYLIAGVYWLADGFHRVAAALKLGEETIPAIVRKADSLLDALIAGAEINMSKENLRGYQDDDRRRYAKLLIKCGAGKPGEASWDWSDEEISRRSSVSHSTVKVMRLALREQEYVPLPDRIWMFRDGVKTGKTRVYGRYGLTRRDTQGKAVSRIGGIQERRSGENAEAILEARRHEVTVANNALASGQQFRHWLAARSIHATSIRASEFYHCGLRLGEAYVAIFSVSDTDRVLACIAKSILALHHLEWTKRGIVIGYRGGGPKGGSALNLAAALNPPVEHMTPEEFVERALTGEFGETPADAVTDNVGEDEE